MNYQKTELAQKSWYPNVLETNVTNYSRMDQVKFLEDTL